MPLHSKKQHQELKIILSTIKQKIKQGFSLVEVMVVVVIIGILAAIAIPVFQDYMQQATVATMHSHVNHIQKRVAICLVSNDAPDCEAGENGMPDTITTDDFTITFKVVRDSIELNTLLGIPSSVLNHQKKSADHAANAAPIAPLTLGQTGKVIRVVNTNKATGLIPAVINTNCNI